MKILILRLSSLGDIVQCMSASRALKHNYPDSELHWFVRSDFQTLMPFNKDIDQVHSFDRKLGFIGLLKFAWALRKENYTHIYDAHNNVRSHIISFLLKLFRRVAFIRRSKNRWKRFMLFKFGKNHFPQPFTSQVSFIDPIKKWLKQDTLTSTKSAFHNLENKDMSSLVDKILLAPSAAWGMKRWPVNHWKQLIHNLPDNHFVIVGGPQDEFCEKLAAIAPERVSNMAGKWNWAETFQAVASCKLVISADTGVLHMADLLERPTLALIGPTAFGFPSAKTSKILQTPLPCRPCTKDGRGKCTNDLYQRCMVDIKPTRVAESAKAQLL